MKNPTDGTVPVVILSIVPTVVFLAAVFSITKPLLNQDHRIQAFVDTAIILVLTGFFMWNAMFYRDEEAMLRFFSGGAVSVFSIVADLVIMMGILLWLLSVRVGRIPAFILMMTSGLVMYGMADLLRYYLEFRGIKLARDFVEFCYVISFDLLAAGAFLKIVRSDTLKGSLSATAPGISFRWVYLLGFPAMNVLLQGFHITNIVFYLILIFFFETANSYIQLSIKNDSLLSDVNKLNEDLERRVREQVSELAFLANQDTLTALMNRRSFMLTLEEAIGTRRDGETIAVLILNLDRFKKINDSYGQDCGDMVLIETSQRLISWNSYGATLARLGGDEYAAFIVGHFTGTDLQQFSAQLVGACGRPITFNGEEIPLTISLGVVIMTPATSTGMALMRDADIAMNRAKSQGYNKFVFYSEDFGDSAEKKTVIEKLLRKADFDSEFELFYQPQFSVADKALIGAEALLRWKCGERGYIPPGDFIPVAEDIDIITEIGTWVMKEAVRQSIDWNRRYGLNLKLGFNISPKQLEDEGFADLLNGIVAAPGFNTDWIDTEITENIMIKDEPAVQKIFELLDSLGISVSIDDFGAGYASFGNLHRFKFGRIKIDKSLIDKVSPGNLSGIQIVKAIITMAGAIGVRTIAEGVETQEQFDILAQLGCDQVQGYFLGRPVPAEVFEQMFTKPPDETV